MAPEAIAGSQGKALRVYQIILILGLGWVAGRLPDLFRSNDVEQARLYNALGGSAMATTGAAPLDEQRIADIAAQVAAQVAAGAANETITRLIAAGWGPAGPERTEVATRAPIIIRAPAQPAPVIHVINQQPAWTLTPGATLASADDRPVAQPAIAPPSPGVAQSQSGTSAHALATEGYAALNGGNKRQGVALLSAAIAEDPAAPQARAWASDVRQLTRRWSAEGYSLTRGSGNSDPLAASPVLGGGQAGATIAWTPDPLARRPVAVFGRLVAAAGPGGALDPDTVEGAAGIRFRPISGIAIDAERRFALGPLARSTWAARVSGGAVHSVSAGRRSIETEVYGEAGVVGFERPDWYAGGQGRAATSLFQSGRIGVDAGAGAWAGWQQSGDAEAGRLDAGPSMRLQLKPWPFSAQLDYRWRTLGNADPGSGPVLTIAGSF